jgi:hypothetical protein
MTYVTSFVGGLNNINAGENIKVPPQVKSIAAKGLISRNQS